MGTKLHEYRASLAWEGNTGAGTASYGAYSRRYRVRVTGKPDLAGSADASYGGDADHHNPEDLFLSAIAACHMITYLALCARRGVLVTGYEDDALGTMRAQAGGGGSFEEVTLRPCVTIGDPAQTELARSLHDAAHELCFIANSCSVPIRHVPTVRPA